ncbi:acriflavin resistance protein [Oceanococcus atlanticus]|uniref:Acriflavin resistance protein n=1 Tax=Oceanococcus atlanticus TaxID=1317117 RepID=A0A1Y1SAK0_9GAMM|nr:efflux RND transporter permease subunit [Oceanococcus atlanticus]ORE85014.1 acriflavin resistance protein [Oceanococcus atlanticus]
MTLSDLAVRRPVVASVISLLLVAFGLVSYDRLSLREYPDIDPPIVSISTNYPGASASVVEQQITQQIEDRISGIEGIKHISSSSQDGRSDIVIEFGSNRDIDGAANDVRDRVSGVLNNLPEEADPPEVEKQDSDADVIMWLNLTSDRMNTLELTDYAERYLQDRFSILPGVARVRVGGSLEYAIRIWLDREAMAARQITVADVEQALREENIELPAGQLESDQRMFTARIERSYRSPEDFQQLVVGQGNNGYRVRLGEIARIEKGAVESRTMFRGNSVPMVGLGIIKQSKANTLQVTAAAKALKDRLQPTLPEGMIIHQSYDTGVFIAAAISEVWKTLAVAIVLVVFVIYVFLGSIRAMLVPALTVPVSLVATFIALYALGFSVNLLTLLAMVLAVGLVVDDSIVMLENIHRRVSEGETPLVAAYRGARQVGFAVVATSVVLVAVFVPISFLEGDTGRLFSEFALTMAGAVFFSTIVALTLSPMLASKLLRSREEAPPRLVAWIDNGFERLTTHYGRFIAASIRRPLWVVALFAVLVGSIALLLKALPSEYAPKEDRGAFFLLVNGPEGATYDYMQDYMLEIESRLMPLVEAGEVSRLLVRAPRSFSVQRFNDGFVIHVLSDWSQRRSAWAIMDDIRQRLADLPGVRAFPVMRQGFGRGIEQPVQFVLGGAEYAQLARWAEQLIAAVEDDNPGLRELDIDYEETQPQLQIEIDHNRAADLGVSVADIGATLQTMLGSRRVTTYIEGGEEYDVILEGERSAQTTPTDIGSIYVRAMGSADAPLVPLSSLVTIKETAGANALNRYNRVRAVTLSADLADGLSLGEALDYLVAKVRSELPPEVAIDFKGQSQDIRESSSSLMFVFLLGLVVVFLVLAAQFESWMHPLVIMLTVPLAIAGALFGLWVTGSTLNIYSQIALVMLVGLAAKNGILIVEFANQLRDQGERFERALAEAARVRFRPIVMTGITTGAGALPLILSSGAGAETRFAMGVVVFFGVLSATLFTLFVVPVAYALLARHTASPQATAQRLQAEAASSGGLDQ